MDLQEKLNRRKEERRKKAAKNKQMCLFIIPSRNDRSEHDANDFKNEPRQPGKYAR